jgi:hypothetical protein
MKTAVIATVALALAAGAAAWSIHAGWPARFGKGFLPSSLALDGNTHNVAGEFLIWRGTGIAPPLPLMIAVALLAGLAAAARRWAIGLLALVGAIAVGGYVGEPMVRSILWGSDYTAARAALVSALLACGVLLALVGYSEWRGAGEPAPQPVGVRA